MPVRKATPADLPAMAQIASRAFVDDDVFGRFMYPYRRDFPGDYVRMWEQKFWLKAMDATRELLVAVDEESGEVVACAVWFRVGLGAGVAANVWRLRLENLSTSIYLSIYNYFYPNRSASPSHIAAFKASIPLTDHLWSGSRSESWQLEYLCTHPEHEGHGHGTALVRWGIERADEERICASVIAAHERDAFYERFGFREVGRADVGPLEGVKGGAVMFRDVGDVSRGRTIREGETR